MVVLTIQHKPNQDLKDLMLILDDLRSYIQQHRTFREFKEKYGLRYIHTGLELTMSIKYNLKDFHPHNNFVFDFDKNPDLTELELSKFIYDLIAFRASEKHGITLKSPYTEVVKKQIVFQDGIRILKDVVQIKGGVSATYDFKEEYPTKFGLAEEVTLAMYKKGDIKGSFHPFQLLDYLKFFELDDKTKKLLIEMYREYALAFRGKTLFRFGRGAVDYYIKHYGFVVDVKDDIKEIEESTFVGDVILEIPIIDWFKFKATDMQIATILQLPKELIKDYIYTRIENNENIYKKEMIDKGFKLHTGICPSGQTYEYFITEYNPSFSEDFIKESSEINLIQKSEIDNLKLLNSVSLNYSSENIYKIDVILI